ncbi:extensin family protein [Sphingomonas profundi]|uniref:extensin family protein n=1 Tax=Alterirhizorhabdus profundi TaxID=2681549 RepID=UPI0012E76DE1|nr:extensin family protein [Sphingomonas profundi]
MAGRGMDAGRRQPAEGAGRQASRWAGALLFLLAACVPVADRRPPARRAAPSPPVSAGGAEDPRALRQCYADLGRQGASYQALPDRVMGGGCSAIGTVKLVRIGIPTTNLGAMRCRLAERFVAWTNEALQTAASAWLDSRVVKIESFGTYACRPVNNQAGNRLSEHGTSNAVDISAFVLASGRRITVLGDWNGPDENARNFLRAVHKAACRRFSVVLGPDANALHRDHLHFDMGRGSYCR